MQIYNTLGRCKEEFVPVRPGQARMYVCGITAYDYCHIGHARSAIVFDVLARKLKRMGLQTLYIRNFTDIDDKIIARALKEGRDWREVGEFFIRAFHEDMDRLGVERPDLEPRATESISQIQDLCQELIKKGHAYATAGGDVYFRVRAYPAYGKLSGRNLDELLAGARVAPDEEKEDPLDFALWKSAKPDEPWWPSPWGNGRPGWHIECSAMNQPFLPLDIHGGGQDLIFPHHENEIAQSEALCACDLAKYWVHNGFVRINSEKMAKSLGNFKTIRETLEDWLPETLRFFLLTKHYRSPLDFSAEGMAEAEKAQKRVYSALQNAKTALERGKWKPGPFPEELKTEWANLETQFQAAMDDDLNTAQALGHIFAQTRLVNRLLETRELTARPEAGAIYEDFLARSREWSAALGLFGAEPEDFLKDLREMRVKRNRINQEELQKLLAERSQARQNRDFQKSDAIREQLLALGVVVKDTALGQIWDVE